jgi:tetratricopeptide (TPR) repeat protein
VLLGAVWLVASAQEPLVVTPEEEAQILQELQEAKSRFWRNNPDWFHTPDEVPFENRPLEVIEHKRAQKRLQKALELARKEREKAQRAEQEAVQSQQETVIKSGLPLLRERDAQGAYDYYRRLLEEDYDDPRVNFYLGLAAMELRRFSEAISAFERVLISEPDHHRARLEMARCYYYQGNLDTAETHFRQVLSSGVPDRVKAHVHRYLALIEAARKRHHTGVTLFLGLAYDSNVRNDIGSGGYRVAPGVAIGYEEGISGEDPEADGAHQQMLRLSHTYDFGELGGWAWRSNLSGFFQNQLSVSERDMRLFSVQTGPVYRGENRHRWRILAGQDRVAIDSAAYLNETLLRVKHMRPLSENTVLETGYLLGNRAYQESVNETRDGQRHELSIQSRHFLDQSDLYFLRGMLGYETLPKDANRLAIGVQGGYTRHFSAALSATGSLGYRWRQNQEAGEDLDNVGQEVKLTDHQYTLNLSGTFIFSRTNQYTLGYSYIDNDSNQNFNRWDKHLLTLNGVWLFSF